MTMAVIDSCQARDFQNGEQNCPSILSTVKNDFERTFQLVKRPVSALSRSKIFGPNPRPFMGLRKSSKFRVSMHFFSASRRRAETILIRLFTAFWPIFRTSGRRTGYKWAQNAASEG